jgi:hypothetical protein
MSWQGWQSKHVCSNRFINRAQEVLFWAKAPRRTIIARTLIGVNDPKAVKRFAGLMAYDTSQKGYWSTRFMGKGEAAEVPIQILTDLESDAGVDLDKKMDTEFL